MEATKYKEVNILLDVLVERIKDALGENLVGVYLYGSLVGGDFDIEISDIDLLAAVKSDVDEVEFTRLEEMHRQFALEYRAWDDRIEVQYLSLEGLRTFKTARSPMANISPGEPFHMIEVGEEWLMNWYFVKERGVVLYGPDPKGIIEPVSKEEFVDSIVKRMGEWREWIGQTRDSRPYQSYVILTACRALYLYRNAEQVSKKRAAMWAEKELPEWAWLIEYAMRWRAEARYMGAVDHEETYLLAERFVGFVAGLMGDEGNSELLISNS